VWIPKVRNESEDFGRDLVDWCDRVSPEPNQVEDLESVLLENVELEYNKYQSHVHFVHSFDLRIIRSRRGPANSNLSSLHSVFHRSKHTSPEKPHLARFPWSRVSAEIWKTPD